MTSIRVTLASCGLLVACMTGWALYKSNQVGQLTRALQQEQAAHAKAVDEAKAGAAALAASTALQARVDALEAQRAAQDKTVAALVDRLKGISVPPAPGAPPVASADLVAGLRDLGVHPSLGVDTLYFPKPEGGTIWTWGQQARRVPSLEQHLQVSTELMAQQDSDLKLTRSELDLVKTQRDDKGAAADHFQAAYGDEQMARQAADTALAKSERLRKMAELPWAAGISYGLKNQDWGLWATRDITFMRLGAEVVRTVAPPTAGGGQSVDARITLGARF